MRLHDLTTASLFLLRQIYRLLEHVSEALKAAENPKVRIARNDDVDKVFEKAYEKVHQFCEKHQIRMLS